MDNISLNDEPRYMKVSKGARTRPSRASKLCARPCSKARMAGFSIFGFLLVVAVITLSFLTVKGEAGGKTAVSSNTTGLIRGPIREPIREPIRVGAFNIRRFGKSRMSDEAVVATIVNILRRYDVVLIQEVRDSSHTYLKYLKGQLMTATGETWTYVSSDPLGRTSYYREQYVFFYRVSSIGFVGSHQVDDSAQDVYEREPFSVELEYWSVSGKASQRVVLTALHAKPTDAGQELRQLPTTIRAIRAISPRALGVIAMGDFNADCKYVSGKARRKLEIFTSDQFSSLIPDSADTTVSKNTDCAYDRVVVYGDKIDARQPAVFNFETFFNLSNDEAGDVSDHYPVEFLLY